jgi:hypothetical protein
LGATAYFDTTGRRSISQLFSCLQDFREFTGRGDADKGYVAGIPLWLTVRPYRATFMQGTVKKTSTQYGVGIEFRGEGIEPARLVESLISASEEYRERTAQRQLTAGPIAVSLDGEREEREPVEITAEEFTEIEEEQEVFIPEIPEALTAEFYPEGPEPDNDEPPVEMDAEPERKTPQRKKKDEPPAETVAPDKWEKARVHIGEMIDAMAMKQYKGNIYDLVFEESGARKLKDIPVDKLVIVEARLFGELKKL